MPDTSSDQHADYRRAQIRLARASSAWLDAYEGAGLTEEIVTEYHAAFAALASSTLCERTESSVAEPTQHADTARAENPCERIHQMHQYADHYQVGQGFYVEKCVNCGLTKGQVRALHNDGDPHGG